MNYELFGMNPKVFGITSIAFSILTAVALYYFLKNENLPEPVPRCASVIFSAHFAHVESVVWYTSVGELTMAFFTIMALLLYRKKRIFFSILFFIAALFSKETGATLILLLPLFDYFSGKIRIKKYLPYIIVLSIYLVLRIPGLMQPANDEYSLSIGTNIITNLGYLLSGLMIPLNFHNLQEYIKEFGFVLLFKEQPWVPLLLIFSVFSYIWMWFKVRETRVFLIAMIFTFLPVIALHGSGQRYLYLPSVFFAIAASLTFGEITRGKCCYRFIYPVVLLGFLIFNQIPWLQSGVYTQKIADEIVEYNQKSTQVKNIFILNPIDNINGAYALRNGSDKLGFLLTNNKIITQKINNLADIPDSLESGSFYIIE